MTVLRILVAMALSSATFILPMSPVYATVYEPAKPGEIQARDACAFAGTWIYSETWDVPLGPERLMTGKYEIMVEGESFDYVFHFTDEFGGAGTAHGSADIEGTAASGWRTMPLGPEAESFEIIQDGRRMYTQTQWLLSTGRRLLTKIAGGPCR